MPKKTLKDLPDGSGKTPTTGLSHARAASPLVRFGPREFSGDDWMPSKQRLCNIYIYILLGGLNPSEKY